MIISTYLTIKQFHVRLRQIGTLDPVTETIRLPAEYAEPVQRLNETILPAIDKAIATLDPKNASAFAGRSAQEVHRPGKSST